MNDVMSGSDGLRILGHLWKKAVSWDLKLDEASWFLDLGEASPFGSTRCAARCRVRLNSQHNKNCVCLSLCLSLGLSLSPYVEIPKSQEGNKSFVPELKKVVSVSWFPMYISHIHILVLFWWLCFKYLFKKMGIFLPKTHMFVNYVTQGLDQIKLIDFNGM